MADIVKILSEDEGAICVEYPIQCPVHFLEEFYKNEKFNGKLVVVDEKFVNYLLNQAKGCEKSVKNKNGNQVLTFDWEPNKEKDWPHTKLRVLSHGNDEISFNEESGKWEGFENGQNWFVVERAIDDKRIGYSINRNGKYVGEKKVAQGQDAGQIIYLKAGPIMEKTK